MQEKTRRFYLFRAIQARQPGARSDRTGRQNPADTQGPGDPTHARRKERAHSEKDEILKHVWPDTFVEEGTLAQNISTLRKALRRRL